MQKASKEKTKEQEYDPRPVRKKKYFTSSDPHHDISKLDFMSAWSGQVKVDIQLISWNTFCYSQLRRLTGRNLLTFFLTYLLAFFLTYLLTYLRTFFLTYLSFFPGCCLGRSRAIRPSVSEAKLKRDATAIISRLQCKFNENSTKTCKEESQSGRGGAGDLLTHLLTLPMLTTAPVRLLLCLGTIAKTHVPSKPS